MAKKKNKLAFPVGLIAIILAIIGLVAVVSKTKDFVDRQTDNTADKEKYEEFLKPVVMFDPDPFDDLTQADNSQLLYAAVWALLMDDEGTEKYSYSTGETIGIVVPQTDIEKYFTQLFGNEIDIASLHSSIDMTPYDITYDSALKSYILPITGVDAAYSPKVYTITEQGSSVILNVGYIGNKAWADIDNNSYQSPEPDKYMTITLRERNDKMYISSIQAADGTEIAAALTTSTTYVEETEETTEESTVSFEVVTDESGEAVTDENGETLTQAITEAETSEGSNEETTEETSTEPEVTE